MPPKLFKDPLEPYIDKKLKVVCTLSLCGYLQDPATGEWIEALSKFEYINKDEWVRVIGVDYFSDRLIVIKLNESDEHGKTKTDD